jgi:hypothetical protein
LNKGSNIFELRTINVPKIFQQVMSSSVRWENLALLVFEALASCVGKTKCVICAVGF